MKYRRPRFGRAAPRVAVKIAPRQNSGKNSRVSATELFLLGILAALGFGLGSAGTCYIIVRRVLKKSSSATLVAAAAPILASGFSRFTITAPAAPRLSRPNRWLAIRTRDTQAVQLALDLRNPEPCGWTEGLLRSRPWFIAPPLHGWTLVFGAGLPAPSEDVDRCYRFLHDLSRKLGQVQFFQADELLQHHAWAQLESGRVIRGYAWAGETLWHQGVKTSAEIALGLNCFGYGENPALDDWTLADHLVSNVEKVPALAREWSLDPAEIDQRSLGPQPGITGTAAGGV